MSLMSSMISSLKSPAFWKKWLLPLLLVAGLMVFFLSGANQILSFDTLASHYGEIKHFISDNQVTAYVVFTLSYFIAVSFSLPIASLLTLAGGALFGWVAALFILIAATAGASVVFIAARSVLAEMLTAKAGPFLQKLEKGFQDNDFQYLLALRLVPIAPFWVVNIVPALLGMRLAPYVIATFIGITPGTLVYVSVATGFDHILAQGQTPDLASLTNIRVVGPLVALGVLALVPTALKKMKGRDHG